MTSSGASSITGEQLQKACASPVVQDQQACETYVQGFITGFVGGQLLADRGVEVCPTQEMTAAELEGALKRAFEDRPDYLGKDASFGITKALLDRFRCAPGERVAPDP